MPRPRKTPADAKAAALAAAMETARKTLLLDTLETRGSDRLDFHDLSVGLLREALAEMFEAGYAAAGGPAPGGMEITAITSRRGQGQWVQGSVAGHTFEALVFPDHGAQPGARLNRSRISKLRIRDAVGREVASFDHGWDVAPRTEDAQRITDLLSADLATRVYDR